MNKYLYILGLVGAALFSACSNSDDLSIGDSSAVGEAKESALIFEASQDSEVPITLGADQSRGLTRAPMDEFTTSDLAVFCLATGTQTGANIPTAIRKNNWSNDVDGDLGGLLVKMNNVSASVSEGNVSYTGEYYYPEASWMKYNYYAYSPKQADSNVTFTSSGNQVSVTFKALDGVHDVIWGRAYPDNPDSEHATGHDPYCADYFRFNTTSEGPQFMFEHKLVHFKFFVKLPAEPYYYKISDPSDTITPDEYDALSEEDKADYAQLVVKVTDMYISNAIKQLSLILANKKDTTLNGKVTPATNKIRTLRIKWDADEEDADEDRFDGSDEKAISVTALTEENAQEVGYLMLPAPPYLSDPNDSEGFRYRIEGTVTFTDGTGDQAILIDMIPPLLLKENPNDPDEYGFEPGKIYNIIINIKKN